MTVDFTIDAYDRKYLEGMTALYNAETAFDPHIAPLHPDRFIELIEQKSYFDPEGLFVAVACGKVVGWIHACVAAGSEPRHDPDSPAPRIRMLIFPRNHLKVGNALVAEATAWLRKAGQQKILAISSQAGYPFYRGLWLGGEPMAPVTMPHVQIALEVGGYKSATQSVFMVAEMPNRPEEIRASTNIEMPDSKAEMAHKPMRESWTGFEPMLTRAMLGGEKVGNIAWVILPHVAERLGAPCVSVWEMGVRETHRQKGIATALLSRTMTRAYDLGARFASVGTQLWNAPAHATYAKLGFRPHCIMVGRTLI